MGGPRSCAIFGQNPMRFSWGFDEEADECRAMKLELAQQIMVLRQQGVTQFYVGCDYGVGLYAARSSTFCVTTIRSCCCFASRRMKNRRPNGRRSFGSGISRC